MVDFYRFMKFNERHRSENFIVYLHSLCLLFSSGWKRMRRKITSLFLIMLLFFSMFFSKYKCDLSHHISYHWLLRVNKYYWDHHHQLIEWVRHYEMCEAKY